MTTKTGMIREHRAGRRGLVHHRADEPALIGARCATCGTVPVPAAVDQLVPEPRVRRPRARRGRAVDDGDDLVVHRRPLPAAAAVRPARRASTSRSPSPRSSSPPRGWSCWARSSPASASTT